MIQPPYLKAGDEVAIVSPSFAVNREKIEEAVMVLESWGLKVRLGKNVFKTDGPFAGTDGERLSDIQEMVADKEVKAILFARGGYGALRNIDKINFRSLMTSPKWFVGFSDITVFHMWLNKKLGMETIHGEMPVNYCNTDKTAETFNTLHNALFGNFTPIKWEGTVLRPADMEGEIVGGNLSLIYSMVGTAGDFKTGGKILFIEDVGEQFYHIDRMLVSLKLAGKFKGINGMLVGAFNKMEDTTVPWGKTIEEIVGDVTSGYGFPVYFNFPAGHVNDNRAFYMGRSAKAVPGNTLLF